MDMDVDVCTVDKRHDASFSQQANAYETWLAVRPKQSVRYRPQNIVDTYETKRDSPDIAFETVCMFAMHVTDRLAVQVSSKYCELVHLEAA